MPLFSKKFVVIEARQFDPLNTPEQDASLAEWCGGDCTHRPPASPGDDESRRIVIHTLEGSMIAIPGDWIIRGIKGEFYPCKPDIFAASYERVAEAASRPPTFSDWAAAVDRSRLGPLSYIHGGPKGCRIQWVREPRDINVYLRGDPAKGGVVMDGYSAEIRFATPAALTAALDALVDARTTRTRPR